MLIKRGLEAVENKHISEFADKYSDRVLNKRSNPNKRVKKVEYKVNIETNNELQERIKQ